MSIYITKNFKYSEFACPHCGKDRPIDPHFIFLLQSLRDKLNQLIYITKGGGLRCSNYNKAIGGYFNSAHLFGRGADIRVAGMDIVTLAIEARDIGFSRIGLYPYSSFVHLDTFRPVPSASWIRERTGNYIYFRNLEDAIKYLNEGGENK